MPPDTQFEPQPEAALALRLRGVTEAPMPVLVPLMRADPRGWTPGLVHRLEGDRTACGLSPDTCTGFVFHGGAEQITCRACLASTPSP
jgi:hypothetical protein